MANRFEELTTSQRRASEELSRLTSQLKDLYRGPLSSHNNTPATAAIVQSARPRPNNSALGALQSQATQLRLDAVARGLAVLANGMSSNTSAIRESVTATSRLTTGLAGSLSSEIPAGAVGSTLLKSGLGLASIGSAIAGLFRRDKREEADFAIFKPPPPQRIHAVNTPAFPTDSPSSLTSDSANTSGPRNSQPASIVVQVNALDSRSFLDRSSEIASAVREAMLHTHPLNDIVSEL